MKLAKIHILLFLFVACTAGNPNEVKTYYEDSPRKLKEHYFVQDDGETKQGLYKSYYENEQIKEDYNYLDGHLSGNIKSYHENGALRGVAYYEQGQLNRERKLFDNKGNVILEEEYEDDQLHGKYEDRWDNGAVRSRGSYSMGKKEGSWNEFDRPDTLGKSISFQELFYHNDTLQGLFRAYYPKKVLKAVGQYLNGVETGKWFYYYQDGSLKEEAEFENGLENATILSYDRDGRLVKKIVRKDGETLDIETF